METDMKAVEVVVTQKLTDTLNEESVANNKIMKYQLKGVQKSLKKPQSFSKEEDLHVLYQVEDEIEKFTFQVNRRRKNAFAFFMNLNSYRKLKRRIKRIQTQISTTPAEDEAATPSTSNVSSSVHSKNNSLTSISDDDDDEKHALTQKSSSAVWPIPEIQSPKFLTRSRSTIPDIQEKAPQRKKLTFSYSNNEQEMNIVGFQQERLLYSKQMSSFSYQEEKLGIFGFNDDIKSLVKRLTRQHQKEMLVPIVGAAGSGKTTLARAVYRNRKIKDHFDCRDWISVSEEYTAEHILHGFSKKVATVKDIGLKNSVFNHLKGKRYLIVLDGVESCSVLEDLKDAFPDENNGSKIILTSCEVWTSSEMKLVPHNLNHLCEEESWNMFLKKAGKEKDEAQIEPRLKQRILHICRGLPLHIVLIAGLLSTKETTTWSLAIAHDQCSDDVLSLCYDDLSVHSRLCLLYLALFPKEYDIPVRRLLRLWLAEGFVKRRSPQQLPEDLVQAHFEDLVDRSMIQITKLRSDNSPRRCRLVSVLHDYLLPKAQGISLFYIHRSLDYCEDAAGPFGVRRIVQYTNTNGALATSTRAPSKVEENATPVSSLSFFFWSPTSSYSNPSDESSTFDPSLLRSYVSFNFQHKDMPEKQAGILLGRINSRSFGLLRVLDLEGVCKPSLPDKLGQLRHLRYLGLRWTFLESLPDSVGDLSNLETLDVKHTSVDSLPDSIWKLKQLRHLNLNNIRLAMPPSSSSTLLTLWGLVVDEKISVNESLGKLLALRELGIKFHLTTSQGALLDWIAKLVHLQSLRLISVDDMGRPSKLILKPLQYLVRLSHLNLLGNLERLLAPNKFPPAVKVLTLSISMLSEDPMETLEQLPCLIVLRLLGDSYIGKRMVCRQGGFKKLRVLRLWKLKELEEWDVEEKAMESLKELDIRCCHMLNKIPSRLLQKQRCLEDVILTNMPDNFIAHTKDRKSKDTSLTINP